MGPGGLRQAAEISVRRAHELQARLCEIEGVRLLFNQPFLMNLLLKLARAGFPVSA